MKKNLLILAIFSTIVTSCCAQKTTENNKVHFTDNPLKSNIDSLVDKSVKSYFKDSNAVGISIGIVIKNKKYFYNYGETEWGNKNLPTSNTLYEIGSTTKTFTGVLLAQAVLDNKINLNDDIRKYLKGNYPNLEYQGKPIKIVHLSNHTSTITRIFPNLWERVEYDSLNPFYNYSRKLLLQGLHKMKMRSIPGLSYSYSNMGVGVLGCILEDIYHKNYYALISKYILKPLQMNNTKIDISGFDEFQLAKAHNKRKPVPYWDMPEVPAIGSLRSNTMDMVKFIQANNLNKTKSIRLSHQITFGTEKKGMGLNWFIYTTGNGYKALEHAGGTEEVPGARFNVFLN